MMTELLSMTITGPAEMEDDGDETVEVTLWQCGSDDDWAFMVTASVDDDTPYLEEGFDLRGEADDAYYDAIKATRSDHVTRIKDRHASHAEALLEAADDWTGEDAKLAKALAKLLKRGKASDALAALKAAGLA